MIAVIVLEYVILACGIYFQMLGVDYGIEQLFNRKWSSGIKYCILLLAEAACCIKLCLPVILFVLLVYGTILLYVRLSRIHPKNPAIKGMGAIVMMLFMELLLVFLTKADAYSNYGKSLRIVFHMYTVVVIALMIMTVISVTLAGEIWENYKKKSRYFYGVVLLKRMMEAVLCYKFMEITGFDEKKLPYLLLFMASVLLDYYIIYDVKRGNVFRQEEMRRASVPLNREAYYAKMEEEHLQIRSMFHDMKNQLMILEGNPDDINEPARRVISSFKEKMDTLGSFYHTGNSDLDLILFDCRNRALAQNIRFDVVIQEGCLSFMEQEDINAIFINAIVNAIEACSKMEEGERSIRIHAGSRLNDVMISIKNTKSSQKASKQLKTSKEDKKFHGFGIPSIQRSADKYQGFVSISEDSEYFQLVILFVREEGSNVR